jgi:hypothetical protein
MELCSSSRQARGHPIRDSIFHQRLRRDHLTAQSDNPIDLISLAGFRGPLVHQSDEIRGRAPRPRSLPDQERLRRRQIDPHTPPDTRLFPHHDADNSLRPTQGNGLLGGGDYHHGTKLEL